MVFWITAAVLGTLLISDFVYRRIVSGRISNLIENVPLFAVVEPGEPDLELTFQIPVADGQELAACLYSPTGSSRGVIIFCPEFNGSRWAAPLYCQALLDEGFVLLGFDFRNQGDSDFNPEYKPTPWITDSETEDVQAVVDYIRADANLGRLPLGIFGVSRGGCAALLAAVRDPTIRSVITDSAYSSRSLIDYFLLKFCRYIVPEWFFKRLPDWHNKIVINQALRHSEERRGRNYVHLEHEAHSLTQPVLLISGSRDSYVTRDITNQLAELVNAEGNFWIVDRARHNRSRSVAQPEYDRRIVQHIKETLLSEPKSAIRKSRVA